MKPDKVIYTDGRDVTVTDSSFKVKNACYNINGITKLSFWTIHPDRWPGVLLMLVGITAGVLGYLRMVDPRLTIRTDTGMIEANTLWLWVGVALAVLGLLILLLAKERYAVRIRTAEGEKNAIVSRKREYIAQIVDAVHSAFDLGPSAPSMMTSKE